MKVNIEIDCTPEEARAFLRHAYTQCYHDFANVYLNPFPGPWI